jgi:hypothetical protein
MKHSAELVRIRHSLAAGSPTVVVSASALHLLILALDTLDDIHRRASMVVGLQGLGREGLGLQTDKETPL